MPQANDFRVTLDVDRSGALTICDQPCFVGNWDDLYLALSQLVRAGGPQYVVTPNVDHLLTLAENFTYRQVFLGAAVRLIDGAPIALLGRLLGGARIGRHTGADLLLEVAGRAARDGLTIALAGGREGVTATAARRLEERYGGRVASVPFPTIDSVNDLASAVVAKELQEMAPDFVFLGLGCPKQEMWFHHWQPHLPSAVFVGSGAAADFIGGAVKRAPKPVRALGMEWAWRLVREPRRLGRRYLLRGPRFTVIVVRTIIKRTGRLCGR